MRIFSEIADIGRGIYNSGKEFFCGKTPKERSWGLLHLATIVGGGIAGFVVGGVLGAMAGAALAATIWQHGDTVKKWWHKWFKPKAAPAPRVSPGNVKASPGFSPTMFNRLPTEKISLRRELPLRRMPLKTSNFIEEESFSAPRWGS